MATWIWKDRVKQTVTGTPGTGAITLSTASSGFQALGAGDDGNSGFFVAVDGTAYEVFYGTYTHAGTSLARTKRLFSSTGSAISLTSATVVFLDLVAAAAAGAGTGRAMIEGMALKNNSTSQVDVTAGRILLNNTVYETTSTTGLVSGTVKDTAGAAVTFAATKAYFVYAFETGGALEFRVNVRDTVTGGDFNDPTFDTQFDYWKLPSTGVTGRRIGKFWTNGSSQALPFYMTDLGRIRIYEINRSAFSGSIVNSGTSTGVSSALTLTPWFTPDDLFMILTYFLARTVSTGNAVADLYIDGGTTLYRREQISGLTSTGFAELGPILTIPYNIGDLRYLVLTNNNLSLNPVGYWHKV